MEYGRLYSRMSRLENGEPVKFYNSEVFKIFPKDLCNIDGKTGSFILEYMDKHELSNEYPVAYMLCQTYQLWYFYYGESKEIMSI